jgi:hypothetical protein
MKALSDPAAGPGILRLVIPVTQAPTALVSRALHKIAYLTLAVIQPELAYGSSFDGVRSYLNRDDAPYRPYGERFLPGQAPGARLDFHYLGSQLDENRVGGNHLIAKVSIHHVEYVVPLLGDIPSELCANRFNWFPFPLPTGKKKITLEMAHQGIDPSVA